MLLTEFKINLNDSVKTLRGSRRDTLEFFNHGDLSVKLYKPEKFDRQPPYIRDKAYIVAKGRGTFIFNGESTDFEQGDFFFVPAGVEHHFEHFTDDFITWVFYCGGYECTDIYY